jgi:hypothetical protein
LKARYSEAYISQYVRLFSTGLFECEHDKKRDEMMDNSCKKILVAVVIVTALSLLPAFFACPQTSTKPYDIEIYGGKAGMTSYSMAIAMAELINKKSTLLHATAIESISLTANFQLLVHEPERRPHTLIVSMVSFH